jgi:membrane-associated phospholipid phosphatase
MLLATYAGSPAVTLPPVFIAGLLFARTHHPIVGLALLFACAASAAAHLAKFVPRRVRPDTAYVQRMLFKTYSFPSGHAFTSLLLYGLAMYLGSMFLPSATVMAAAVGLFVPMVAVGFSRIYLGAHYVLDVLGGWALALGVLALIIIFMAG